MTKLERELTRAMQPLLDQAGATARFLPQGREAHPKIEISLNGQTRWMPYSKAHNIPEVAIYHTIRKLKAILAELTSGQRIPYADPRKRH